MAGYLIDSWPVLEWLQEKAPVAQAFSDFLDHSIANASELYMSRINFGEVVYILAKNLPEAKVAEGLRRFRTFPVQLMSVDDDLIDEAVAIKSCYSLSYADTFAIAQAIRLAVPIVTGDKEFLPPRDAGLVKILWLGA